MSDHQYRPGTSSFDDAPDQKRKRFDDDLIMLPNPIEKRHTDIRPVGGVFVLQTHYVPFKGADGKDSGFFALCPDWDMRTQAVKDDKVCPCCRDFGYSVPKEVRIKASQRYYFHAFNISELLKKSPSEDYFGLVSANGKNWEGISKAKDINNGTSPADPRGGCTLHWTASPSSFKAGSLEYSFSAGNTLPVKYDKETGVWKIKVNGKVWSGEEQDYLAVVPEPDLENLIEGLERHGLYEKLEAAGVIMRGKSPKNIKTAGKAKRKQVEDDEDDLDEDTDLDGVDDDEDDEDDEDVKPSKKPGKKAGKKAPVEDDDEDDEWEADDDEDSDDDDDDDEDVKPAKKPGKKTAKKPVDDEDDDEDDDWEEDDEDDEDDDDVKPAKQPGKPAGKPGKKAPVEDEDDWEEDDEDADEEDEDDEPPVKPGKKGTKAPAKKPGKKVVEEDDEDEDTDDEDDDDDDEDVKPSKKPAKAPTKPGKKPAKKPVDDDEDDDWEEDDEDDEPPAKKPGKKPRK
jgi:hypothetical protein